MAPTSHVEPAVAAETSVLLVDDIPANLVALQAILEPLGYRLVTALSGDQALRRLLEEDFAVILLDVQMPGMDGFETARLIKARPRSRHTPIIFVTAISRDEAHVFKGYATGAVDYLVKPFNPDVLRSKVKVFADLHQARETVKQQAALLAVQEREASTRRLGHRFRELTDSMPLCVWGTRRDGTLYYANRVAQEYAGLTPAENARLGILGAVHPDDHERVQAAWNKLLAGEQDFELPYRLRRARDGAWRWHMGRAVPERDDEGSERSRAGSSPGARHSRSDLASARRSAEPDNDGREITGWIVTAADIDDERAAREQAETANRTKDEFLATVSHELRTPLTAILGWARMLSAGRLDQTASARALETIERNARLQNQLVDDILDVSRITVGQLRIEPQLVEVDAVVASAVESIRPQAEARGMTLGLVERRRAVVKGDPMRLQQIISNLIANAVKFTPRGGLVDVRVVPKGNEVTISVTDTGMGIQADFVPFLFERFRQADGASTRSHGGLGLGLAIARHLVELHGGTITVESEGPGKGSKFTVHLPRVRDGKRSSRPPVASTSTAAADSPGPSSVSLENVAVLLVDDATDTRELIAMALERYGARVVAVDSAEDALRALQSSKPDIVLSDIGLPGADGYDLIRRIRQLGPGRGDMPAAALTAYAGSEDSVRALAAGFQRHVPKPVDPDDLASLIAGMLGR